MTDKIARLGAYIKNKRIEMGLRQVDLAEKAGCSWIEVSRIEGGKRKHVPFEKVMSILSVLGDPIQAFLASDYIPGLSEDEAKLVLDPAFGKVYSEMHAIDGLSSAEKERLAGVLLNVVRGYVRPQS